MIGLLTDLKDLPSKVVDPNWLESLKRTAAREGPRFLTLSICGSGPGRSFVDRNDGSLALQEMTKAKD